MDYMRGRRFRQCVEEAHPAASPMRDDQPGMSSTKSWSKKMKKTTWGDGGNSWYYTKDGRNTTLYPGFATEYVLSVRNFDFDDYSVKSM
jgi:hypothetical protein